MGERYVETLQGCRIYYVTPPDIVTAAYHSPCVPGYYIKITAVRKRILEIYVGPPEPEPVEEPSSGLLAQIIASVMVVVNDALGSLLQPIYGWVTGLLADAQDVWEGMFTSLMGLINDTTRDIMAVVHWAQGQFDALQGVTIPGILAVIMAKGAEIYTALDNTVITINDAIDETVVDLRAYVDGRLAVWDPTGFLENPLGYVSGVFAASVLVRETNIIKSFLEGFEEGLEE